MSKYKSNPGAIVGFSGREDRQSLIFSGKQARMWNKWRDSLWARLSLLSNPPWEECAHAHVTAANAPSFFMKTSSLTRFAWVSIAADIVTIALKTAAYFLTGLVGLSSDAVESLGQPRGRNHGTGDFDARGAPRR